MRRWLTAAFALLGLVFIATFAAVRAASPGDLEFVLVALVMLALATLAGAWAAGRLTRPLHDLARASEELRRGRLELELPSSGLPEVRAIASALEGIARSLQDDRVDVTGGLVADVRRGAVHTEALRPLVEVAHAVGRRWTEALAGVGVRVFVEGDGEVRLTPGPLEELLDEILLAVRHAATDEVRLTFVGEPDQVLVTVAEEDARHVAGDDPHDSHRARAARLARAAGGVLSEDEVSGGLVVRLPLRWD